jgi:endonuclease/exonuclease/phosphatase family metal-dependent hydrolase
VNRPRRANGLAALLSMVVLVLGLSAATAGQDSVRLPVVPVVPSDVLVHPPLGPCAGVGQPPAAGQKRLRIGTWNIRAARSAPLEEIAAEVQAMAVDVIALQEVDQRTRRSGFVDEPAAIAASLGFQYVFAASIKWDEGDYGLAVLSRYPLTEVQRHRLDATTATEPRIVLEVTVCAGGRPLRLFNHHADNWAGSREAGFAQLRGILQSYMGGGVLVMGDFNEQPEGEALRYLIDVGLVDLGSELGPRVGNRRRIDYVLADNLLAGHASRTRVWPTNKSDHHAMLVDIEW